MTKPPPAPGSDAAKVQSFNTRFNAGLNQLLTKLRVEDVPHIKRIIITVVGGTILIIGAALLFLPGPGALVILGGLAVLGTEYAWARRWMRKGKRMARKALSQTQKILSPKDSTASLAKTRPTPPSAGPAGSADHEKTTLVH